MKKFNPFIKPFQLKKGTRFKTNLDNKISTATGFFGGDGIERDTVEAVDISVPNYISGAKTLSILDVCVKTEGGGAVRIGYVTEIE